MWLSEKAALGSRQAEPGAQVGMVTEGGTRPSVMLEGEKRRLEIIAPGGFFWAPSQRDQVLVTRCGDESFVSGALGSGPVLAPGEVCVKSDTAYVFVRADGTIVLEGVVNVAGQLLLNGVNILNLLRGH